MGAVRAGIASRVQVTREVVAVADLRRLNLGYLASQLAGWAYLVAIGVYAYEHGGAGQVGLMTVIRFTPALVASPFAGALADRFPRPSVLVGVDLVRATALVVAGVLVITGAPPLTVYLAVAGSALAGTAFEPAKAALLPSLTQTPEQLTAANALGATIESVGLTVGPALGGLLLAVGSVQLVFFTLTGASLLSALLISRVEGGRERPSRPTEAVNVLRRSLAGFETIAGDHVLRLVVAVFAVQMVAFGLLNVFVVAVALGELHSGATGVGWLNAACGVGGILGGILTLNLAGRKLAAPLAFGMILLGGGYVLISVAPYEAAALAAMILMNLGGLYVDIATFTLLQRAVSEDILARAFSVIGTIIVGSLLLGGALAPALIATSGLRGALGATGAVVLIAILAALPALRRIDAAAPSPLDGIELLRKLALFQSVSVPVLEQLASELVERQAEPGETIITQGDAGDRYYVIVAGSVEVSVDGASVTTLGPGDAFGEISLLLDSPRTATVVAATHLRLASLTREAFLTAVSGDEASFGAGYALANRLLSRAKPAAMASAV